MSESHSLVPRYEQVSFRFYVMLNIQCIVTLIFYYVGLLDFYECCHPCLIKILAICLNIFKLFYVNISKYLKYLLLPCIASTQININKLLSTKKNEKTIIIRRLKYLKCNTEILLSTKNDLKNLSCSAF